MLGHFPWHVPERISPNKSTYTGDSKSCLWLLDYLIDDDTEGE